MRGIGGLIVALGMLSSSMAFAEPVTVVPPAYVVAAEDNGIPPEILYAVASAESVVSLNAGRRPWPWTLNVAGESMRFANRVSACAALRDALEETRIVDVGITQLNVRWQPGLYGPGERFEDPCEALDPYANLSEAAKLIRRHYDDSRDWLIAAGRYHRPAGGKPAARYREKVREELVRLESGTTSEAITSSNRVSTDSASSPKAMTSAFSTSKRLAQGTSGADVLTWITPSPRSPDTDVTWITPSPRRWLPEVASH